MRYILIMLCCLGMTIQLNAQDNGTNISARLKGKKVVFTKAEAIMEASFSPFYTLQFSFYTTPVYKSKDDMLGDYDYVSFSFRVSRRQYQNKLPWPQTFSKFLSRYTNREELFAGLSFHETPVTQRGINLVIEKVDTQTSGSVTITGTIEYKHSDDTNIKGPFKARLIVK